jgi:hypothetical protein
MLTHSATGEALRAMRALDLSDLEVVKPLRGYGRD